MSLPRVRLATCDDWPAIEAVHLAAFPSDLEARLVALLIEHGKATISLVAEIDGQVVGHILFSPASVGPVGPAGLEPAWQSEPTHGLGLAPVAVLPAFQNQGIGSALVRKGLVECRRIGAPWVVVLGHEFYYPRFGFAPASRWNLTGDYGSTGAFQFLPLSAAAESLDGGHIHYAPEFGEVVSCPA